ncbi:MAG: gliding motility-associated C-terminal domain-containing protein [Bacteroidota bacterium]
MMKSVVLFFLIVIGLTKLSNAQTMVVNEIMFKPGPSTSGCDQRLAWQTTPTCGREYIELYNSDCNNDYDLSGYVLASATTVGVSSAVDNAGSICFPPGTIVPAGSFLVVGGGNDNNAANGTYNYLANSFDFKIPTYLGTQYLCLNTANSSWFLGNIEGWMALYEPNGNIHSAVYWSSNPNNILTVSDFAYNPCSPTAYTGTQLKSAKQIYQSTPALIQYMGNPSVVATGNTFSRMPDGGTFQPNRPSTIGPLRSNRCNDGLCLACGNLLVSSTPDTCSAHNGTITAQVVNTITSPPPYTFSLTGASTASPPATTVNPYTFSNLAAGTYVVKVIDSFTPPNTTIDTIIVTTTGSLAIQSITSTPSGCSGNVGTATVVASGSASSYTYLWNTTPAQTTATATNLPQGNYSVTVTSGGCVATSTVTVTNNGALTVQSITATAAGCNASDGTATVVATGSTPPYTYLWNTTPPQTTETATNLPQGNYTVTVTLGVCSTTSSVQVTSTAGPSVTTSNTPEHCNKNDGTITINATSSTGTCTYQWSPSQPNVASLANLSAGSYLLTVSDGGVCSYQTTITIVNLPGPDANFAVDPEFAQPGTSINFTSSNSDATTWNWQFGDGATSSGSPNMSHVYENQGNYIVYLTIVDHNGCIDSTSHMVTIVTVIIPNVITPNGDGANDFFEIKGLEDVPGKNIYIFNRWGRKVFESPDYQNNWNAPGLEDGVYFYTLWIDVLKKEYHGSVTVFQH